MPPGDEDEIVDFSRRVVSRDGRALEFPTAEAADAALAETDTRGVPLFTRDTPEAREARRLRREYGGRGLEAGAVAAARGATLGLSDLAARGIGGEETAEYLRNIEEANPEASTLGEVAGAVAPVLLTGPIGGAAALEGTAGRGLLRGALGLVGAPIRAATGLAEAAGGLAGRAVAGTGGGLLRRAATGAVRLGVEGAIDGAAAEAGSMLSEAALGRDPDLTAEAVLARLGTSAFLGAGVGSVLGGVGGTVVGASRAAREGAEAVLSRGWRGTIGTDLDPAVAREWARWADSGESGGEAIRLGLSRTPEGAAFRRVINRGDEVFNEGSRSIERTLGLQEQANARVLRYWREGLRHEEMERLVDGSLLAEQARSARALADEAESRMARFAEDFQNTTPGAGVASVRRNLAPRRARIAAALDAIEGGGLDDAAARRLSAELNANLNAIKQEIDGLARRTRGLGPAADAFGDMNNTIRSSLEDAAIWGDEAATAHREINAAFSRWFTTRQAFARRFLENGGTLASRMEENPFETIPMPDSRRVRSFMGELGTVANGTDETTFLQTTESAASLLDVMDRHLSLDPAARAAAVEARGAYRSLREAYEVAGREARQLNQWRHLENNRSLGRAIIGGALGTAVAGPVGGLALTALTNPGQVIRGLGLIERWAGGTTTDIADGVSRFMRAGRTTAESVGRRARPAAVLGSVRAYNARIERLEEESSNPTTAIERISTATRGMDAAPRVRDSITRVAVRANSYLNAVRPRGGDMPGEVRPGVRAPANSEVARFMRRARAVDDPLTIIEDLESGEVSPDAVDAVRQVYPALYAQIRTEALRQIAETPSLSHRSLVSLGTLLGVPTTPSLHPAIVAAMQSTYVRQPPPAATMRPPRLAEGVASGVDSLEARRAGARA